MEGLEIGQHYRSEKTKVLMTVTAISKKENNVTMRVADSDFYMDGPLNNIEGFFKQIKAKEITEDEYEEYLLTYTDDIKQQQLEEQRRENAVASEKIDGETDPALINSNGLQKTKGLTNDELN